MNGPEEKQKKVTRRELMKMAAPLGRVTLVNQGCTACGICAASCDAGALSMVSVESAGTCQLLFRHLLCTACGRCAEACPEKCLRVERTVDPARIEGPDEVLFEDEVVRCAECGKPFATRAMVDSMKEKLGITGQSAGAYLEICPVCKAGVRLSGVGR